GAGQPVARSARACRTATDTSCLGARRARRYAGRRGVTPPLLDTSFLVRYLTGDPPNQAQTAATVVDAAAEVALTLAVLAETAHVVRSVYKTPRDGCPLGDRRRARRHRHQAERRAHRPRPG